MAHSAYPNQPISTWPRSGCKMTTNRSDTNAFAIKLIASVVSVRQWIGWLKKLSATDHSPKPFASAFQAWNFQTHASPCGAAPARTSAVSRGGGVWGALASMAYGVSRRWRQSHAGARLWRSIVLPHRHAIAATLARGLGQCKTSSPRRSKTKGRRPRTAHAQATDRPS